MKVKLIAITQYLEGDGTEGLIEYAGRKCYNSKPQGNPGAFIQKLLTAGHETPIEHASATFDIEGISRVCSHQLVRHRIASFSQRSMRYVDQMGAANVIPPSIMNDNEALLVWKDASREGKIAYTKMINLGIPKEDARFVLPLATETGLVVTMNFRELRAVFKLRLDKAAQWEIRELAGRMLELVRPYAPSVFADFPLT